MYKSQENEQDGSKSTRLTARRGFFATVFSFLGGLALWGTSRRVSGAHESPNELDSPFPLNYRRGQAEQKTTTSRYYPKPTYVPEGYRLDGQYTNRTDGLGGGLTEIALWFKNPQLERGYNNPLSIYMTPEPKYEYFRQTTRGPGTALQLTMDSGETVSATYHDGMWAPSQDGSIFWNTSNVHSIVFKLGDLAIGIRGSRQAGIDYEQLILIAKSIR